MTDTASYPSSMALSLLRESWACGPGSSSRVRNDPLTFAQSPGRVGLEPGPQAVTKTALDVGEIESHGAIFYQS